MSGGLRTYDAPAGVRSVVLRSDEVSTLGSLTGNPDFYTVEIAYAPDTQIMCSKALKDWFTSIRADVVSAERLAVRVRELVEASCRPLEVRVTVTQKPRGGVEIRVTA